MDTQNLAQQIDAVLPQTQCTRCNYPSCYDYADAVAKDEAEINQCPPGGNEGIIKLSQITGRKVIPLNPDNGTIKNKTLVVIDEDICIGCTLCIKACPVDAILGSNKMLHTVVEVECTGCDLCVPVCPVDCIYVVDDKNLNWSQPRVDKAKSRFEAHNLRLKRDAQEREQRLKSRGLRSSQVDQEDKTVMNTVLADILSNIKK